LRALLEGLDDLPTRSEAIRERLRLRTEQKGPKYLHRILSRCDAASASRIAPRDTHKIIRAIEVSLLAGKPASQLLGRGRDALQGFTVIKIGLVPPRAKLYARIDSRVEEMFAAGWIEEVRSILRSGVSPSAKAFTFIGYTQIREHILHSMPLEPAVPEIRQATRRYAKRQITWFRRESNVHWLTGFGSEENIQAEALKIISTASAD
jgi:tRNA dimethylallyltransferase